MRYRRIDLNLVAALDVLLAERNVSRAAEVLNLSQSAVSGILARLREYFNDPLLVQVGRSLQLTPLAESLRAPAHEAMARIDTLIDTQPAFEPATAQLTVRIATSDYVVSAYLSDVLQRISRLAPGLQFDLQPTTQIASGSVATLESAGADFIIVPAHLAAAEQPSLVLFEDSYTVLAWADNTQIGERLSLTLYQRLGHVVFGGPSGSQGNHGHSMPWFDQWYLNQYGDNRRFEVKVSTFNLLGNLVVGTQRLATVQTRLAERLARSLPLRCLPLPMAAPRLTEVLQWPRHRQEDPAMVWLRSQLQQGPQQASTDPAG